MYYTLLIAPLILLAVLAVRPITTFLHELGHAIPAALMSKQRIYIYVGSYSNIKSSLHFRVGLLDIWFRYNPFLWLGGISYLPRYAPFYKQIIYTLTGPLVSFIIALLALHYMFVLPLQGGGKAVLGVFFIAAVADLVINLIPIRAPIMILGGRLAYNDGYHLQQLFYLKGMPSAYWEAADLYTQGKYEEAGVVLMGILESGVKKDEIYRLAIHTFMLCHNYAQAEALFEAFRLKGHLNSDDYAMAGLIYARLEQLDKALSFFDKSLLLAPSNTYALNNKGFILVLQEQFDAAILLFDKVIALEETLLDAYSNRGLAKIKIGQVEEGLADIHHAIEADENNAQGYRNLGIYFLERGEFTRALELFKQAKALDSESYMIDQLIEKCKL